LGGCYDHNTKGIDNRRRIIDEEEGLLLLMVLQVLNILSLNDKSFGTSSTKYYALE